MDLVDSVAKVVKVAIQIKEQVETVHQNKEDCKTIATRVERLRATVECLNATDVSKEQTMILMLNDLEETFLRALKLVKACQTKNVVWFFLTARNVNKQLREVQQAIMEQVSLANFGNGVQQSVMMTKEFIRDPAAKPKKFLKVLSMLGEEEIQVDGSRLVRQNTYDAAGEVDDAHRSNPADGSRSQVEDEKESFPAGSLEDTISRFTNFTLSELKRVTNNFSTQHVIGEGGYAWVYKAVLGNGAEVAIKRFYPVLGNIYGAEVDLEDDHVARYAQVFSVIREHENIVRFLGYCHETKIEMLLVEGKCVPVENRHMLVVEEYMPNGTLSDIVNGSSRQLDWSSAFRIIRGIARGVAHIHTKGAVHLDLKPDNVLLDSDMNPKICDFEVSMILNENGEDFADERVSEKMRGTIGYMPPEYIMDGILSFKHDVFSFGIVLLNTISKPGLLQDSTDWISDVLGGQDNVDSILLGASSRDEAELKEIKRCMDIGLQCVAKKRTDRPTMWEVVDMLDGKEQPRKTSLRNKASSFKKKKGRA